MILKISMTGIKTKFRDYLILFSGLIIAVAIFYMFQSIASNKDFLESSNTVKSIVLVFQLGTILLIIITSVYIMYANSFLMLIRQRTYALFLMLGSRTAKIAEIIFVETLIIGISATFVGILIGMGLTSVVSSLIVEQLNLTIKNFQPTNITSIVVTVIVFSILFFLTSVINALSIIKKPILQLLKEQSIPKKSNVNPALIILETFVGVSCLSIGYHVLSEINKFKIMGITIAMITIVLGTYFSFHSVFVFILTILKRVNSFSMKKINNFVLSQLKFRIREFTQVLTMVSILFALALGAITVGIGFQKQALDVSNNQSTYDLVINNGQKIHFKDLRKLDIKSHVVYQQKEDDKFVYYNIEDFNKRPFQDKDIPSQKINTYNGQQLANNEKVVDTLRKYGSPEEQEKALKILSEQEFEELNLTKKEIQFIKVKNFQKNLKQIKEIVHQNIKNNPSIKEFDGSQTNQQKYSIYEFTNAIVSGFQFIGLFLGLAFLTMLASCLMFKIMSGANADEVKYRILNKIGTRRSLMKQAIWEEIGILFLLPGLIGVVHVLFGLQMFKSFMENPYEGIEIPSAIFILLYVSYYIITVYIYSNMVLPKKK